MASLQIILSNLRYFAPVWVFASLNIITGTWVLYLPHVKTKLALNDAQIGIALFSLALGLLISILFIPYLNKRFGVGRCTIVGIVLFATLFNFPLMASNYLMLCSSLFAAGVFSGFTDVSMNALVSTIEKEDDAYFMSAAHGFFSLGGFIGAGIGSLLMVYLSAPVWHMVLISSFIVVSNLILAPKYLGIKEEKVVREQSEERSNSIYQLLGLALVAFIIMFNEGAVEHWSNLFLFDVIRVSEAQAGLGFIAFSLTMTLGRFLGDGISQKIGSNKMIAYGSLIACVAYLLILSSELFIAVIGFGVLGMGLSVIIPELFRLAGQAKGIQASKAISIVSGIGFAGFLLGPVVLGLISNWIHLTASYIFLLLTVLIAMLLLQFHLKRTSRQNGEHS